MFLCEEWDENWNAIEEGDVGWKVLSCLDEHLNTSSEHGSWVHPRSVGLKAWAWCFRPRPQDSCEGGAQPLGKGEQSFGWFWFDGGVHLHFKGGGGEVGIVYGAEPSAPPCIERGECVTSKMVVVMAIARWLWCRRCCTWSFVFHLKTPEILVLRNLKFIIVYAIFFLPLYLRI